MLSCDELLRELSGYLDDEAAASIRRDLKAHLHECRTCRVLYDTARKTLRIVTDSRSFDLPEGLSDRIVDAIMKKVPRGRED